MYLLKTKRNSEALDSDESHESSSASEDVFDGKKAHLKTSDESLKGRHSNCRDVAGFDPDELPDGFCISPQRLASTSKDTEHSAVRPAEYIGSFSVIGEDQRSRAEYVRKQLADMREVARSKAVLLVISLSGVKVCSSNGESVYMAHALKRISYATCDPEYCQFSFLAREPKGHTNIQYCHAFITKNADEAEELNNIVGNAFQMAYAYQRQQQTQQQPTFNQLIEKQIEEQKVQYQEYSEERQKQLEKKLSQISTATVADRVRERKEKKRREMEELEKEREKNQLAGKDRTTWAKHIVGRTKHKGPFPEELQNSAPSLSCKQNCDSIGQTNRCSIVSIKEAFESGGFQGSPVMALKETIDNAFNGQINNVNSTNQETEHYLYPVNNSPVNNGDQRSSEESPPPEMSPRHSSMLNRPLPATPSTDKKSKKSKNKSQKEGRKSGVFGERSDDSPQGTSSRSTNGHAGQGSRPPSVQYQNDSPVHYGNNMDVMDGTLYQGGPPTPKRYDSLKRLDAHEMVEQDELLKQAQWYQAGVPREIALEVLAQQEIGSFIVRDSTTHPNCYALSVKVPKFENPTGISHYLIHRTQRGGFKLKGLEKEWPSLTALVTHHTVMPEMLPCTLRMPRNSNNPAFKDKEDKDEREEDEDYQKLADFSSMMNDLKM